MAALGLIGRRGVRRLAMQEIAESAGVSRGTLYRYFPSKDLVLAAAAAYDERRFSSGLDARPGRHDVTGRRIGAFMAYSFDFIRSHPARSLFESEPGFVMSYLLDHLPPLRTELWNAWGTPSTGARRDQRRPRPRPAGRRHRPPVRQQLDHPRVRRRVARAIRKPTFFRLSRRTPMETETETTAEGRRGLRGRGPTGGHGPRDGPQPAAGLQADAGEPGDVDRPAAAARASCSRARRRSTRRSAIPRSSRPTWTRSTSRTSGP